MDIKAYLQKNKIVSDGAFGTYFGQLYKDTNVLPELANITEKEKVQRIHREYIEAGARLIRTNTFAANTISLNRDIQVVKQIIRSAFDNAIVVANTAKEQVFVAADIGPIPEMPFEDEGDVEDEYKEIIDTFLVEGAQIFCFETFSDDSMVATLAQYIKEKEPETFVFAQFSLNKYGYTKMGIRAQRILDGLDSCEYLDGVGFNCGIGPAHLKEIYGKLSLKGNKFYTAMPNSGYPELLQDRAVYSGNSDYFADSICKIAQNGISILGGCCGTTPDDIKKIAKSLDTKQVFGNSIVPRKEEGMIEEPKINSFISQLEQGKKVILVELDPPYDAEDEKIMDCAHLLKASGVDMITFADSPMGKARVDSIMMGIKVKNQVGIPVMPHIACRDKNRISMRAGIMGAYLNGIENFLFVTGDPVPADSRSEISGVFDFNSIKLMQYVSEMNEEHFKQRPVSFGGAINYNRANLDMEMKRVEKKMAAGAQFFLTQPIFDEEDVNKVRKIKEKTGAKILCGLMPLISYRNASFIKNEIFGINVPDEVLECFRPDMTREEGEAAGVKVVRSVMEKLESIADGYYFMLPFNRVHLVKQILK